MSKSEQQTKWQGWKKSKERWKRLELILTDGDSFTSWTEATEENQC